MSENPAGPAPPAPSGVEGFIPDEDYKKILAVMPVPCVDVVVVYNHKFLLGKRVNEPAKGQWWIPGGRVFKNETLEETAVRKIKEELGLETSTEDFRFLTGKETMFDNSALEGVSSHTINSVFLLKCEEEPVSNLEDSDFSELKWFEKVDKDLHPYIQFVLKKAGFK